MPNLNEASLSVHNHFVNPADIYFIFDTKGNDLNSLKPSSSSCLNQWHEDNGSMTQNMGLPDESQPRSFEFEVVRDALVAQKPSSPKNRLYRLIRLLPKPRGFFARAI